MRDYRQMAASLYDGGWRAEDKVTLKNEYSLTEKEAQAIYDELKDIDKEVLGNE